MRDLALALLKLQHEPIVYSPKLGSVARELLAAGIDVSDDLDDFQTAPDIIHGNQHRETMTALLHFSETPAVYFYHNAKSWLEDPPRFPRLLRYVAVDDNCYERLTTDHAIPKEKARTILNFVDLDRFQPRGLLPDRPRRALVFSNYAHEHTHLKVVREACRRASLELDSIGESIARPSAQPELELQNYDIVFAKARAALESLAVGAAVVLCDADGAGPMVSTQNFEQLRRLNFGSKTLQHPLAPETIQKEIARYDASDAAAVSRTARNTVGLHLAIYEILDVYEEVLREHKLHGQPDRAEEGRAAARYLRHLSDEFAAHSALTLRWRNRLLNVPVFGPRLIKLKSRFRARGRSRN